MSYKAARCKWAQPRGGGTLQCACEHDYVAALAGSEDNAKLGLTMARPWTFVCKCLGGLQEHFTRSWAFSGPRKRGWARVISKCRNFLAVN